MIKEFDLKLKKERQCKYIAGYDECGRGAICGNFVSAVCVPNDDFVDNQIDDSKKIIESKRFELSELIKKNSIFYKIIEYTPKEIDSYGIQFINKKSFEDLSELVPFVSVLHLIDGNIMSNCNWCISLEKGELKSFAIACASILAKAYRDEQMIAISGSYPEYNLDKNKGYGQEYISKVKEFGIPKDIHRHSYNIKLNEEIKLF